jgi:hypothetical protein
VFDRTPTVVSDILVDERVDDPKDGRFRRGR